jgi:hypothetical protein
MRSRWAAVGVAVAALVGVNLVARLVLRLAGPPADVRDFWVAVASLGAMAVLVGVTGFRWARQHLLPRVAADLFVVVVVTGLLVTVVGPLVSGGSPFGAGLLRFLVLLGVAVGVLTLGAAIGVLLAVALGVDPKSRAYQAYVARSRLPKAQQRPGKARTRPASRAGRR